jgi:hypothetical protein
MYQEKEGKLGNYWERGGSRRKVTKKTKKIYILKFDLLWGTVSLNNGEWRGYSNLPDMIDFFAVKSEFKPKF